MFLDASNYKASIEALCTEGKSIDLAIAFWGQGADQLLSDASKKFRVLCNLRSGGTNPSVIEKLLASKHISVRHADDLHAKIALSQSSLIVGSANFSTSGLNIQEAEFDGWQEAGYLTQNADDLAAAKNWFAKQWKSAVEVTPEDITEAKRTWENRRKNRHYPQTKKQTILSMPIEALKERNLFVAVFQAHTSKEANKKSEEKKGQESDSNKLSSWTFYEDWDPKDLQKERMVIDVYIGKRGAVRVSGPYKIFAIEEYERQQKPFKGDIMTLYYAYKLDEILEMPAKTALKGIKERVEQLGSALLGEDGESQFLSLEEFIEKLQQP